MDDAPSVALASRLWHGLMLLVIGSVAVGAGYGAGPVASAVLVAGVLILVAGYLGLAMPRWRDGVGQTPMLAAVLLGTTVMIADRPAAVALLLAIVPQLFYFAPLRAAVGCTALLTAVSAASFVVNDVPDTGPAVAVLGLVTGASVAVGVWLSQVFHLNARQRDTITQLEESRAMVESMAHLAGAAHERAQMAQDIHDGMAQQLSAMVMVLREAGQRLDSGQSDLVADRLDVARRQCELVLAECRFLIGQQSTAGMSSSTEIVRHLAGLFQGAAGVPTDVRVELETGSQDLDAAQRATLQKILTESLSNCLKHADATSVDVRLSSACTVDGRPAVRLEVIDDGRGFDADTVQAAGPVTSPGASAQAPDQAHDQAHDQAQDDHLHGYGLPGLLARVARQGGDLQLNSRPGAGTRVSALLPRCAPAAVPWFPPPGDVAPVPVAAAD